MLVLASREEGRWHVPGPMVASRAAGEPPDALPCSLAIIVVAVTISTRRPVAMAGEVTSPPSPTEPGSAVEDTIEVPLPENERTN